VQIDPESGMLATPYCPTTISEVYISGTQPVTSCPLHARGQSVTHVAGWEIPGSTPPGAEGISPAPHVGAPPPALGARRAPLAQPPPAETAEKAEKPKEKKSFWQRLRGVFK
jgi:hypothetical protein